MLGVPPAQFASYSIVSHVPSNRALVRHTHRGLALMALVHCSSAGTAPAPVSPLGAADAAGELVLSADWAAPGPSRPPVFEAPVDGPRVELVLVVLSFLRNVEASAIPPTVSSTSTTTPAATTASGRRFSLSNVES